MNLMEQFQVSDLILTDRSIVVGFVGLLMVQLAGVQLQLFEAVVASQQVHRNQTFLGALFDNGFNWNFFRCMEYELLCDDEKSRKQFLK